MPVRIAGIEKKRKIKVGQTVESRKPSWATGGNVNQCSHFSKEYGGSSRN